MKTAEEWAIDINGIKWLDNSHPTMTNVVKQIQLDAMKEGMRRAADEVEMKGVGIIERQTVNGKFDAWMYRGSMKEAILTAAEQLTEKDL